jgi:sec-independent protein translocase protein TatC
MAKKDKSTPDDMSFWEHLDVLRAALFRSLIAVAIAAAAAFFMKRFIYDVVILGPKNPEFFTNQLFCDLGKWLNTEKLCINTSDFVIQNLEVAGQFKSHLLITFVAGIILAMPYIVAEIWWFIKPALSFKEKKYSSGFVIATNFLFMTGVAFGYYLIVPLAINFLIGYELSPGIENFIRLGSYIRTVVMISLSTGIVFQLPVIIYFLSKLGIVNDILLKKYRKHAIIIFFILSAIITPPDVISQFLVAIPLLGLYEISILISRKVSKARIEEL